MLSVEINDIKFQFPVGWHEVTLDQFMVLKDIDTEPDSAKRICKTLEMLTGISTDTWFNMRASDVDSETVLSLISWMQTPIDWEKVPPPTEVVIDGNKYKVPTDLSMETYGQILMFDSKVLPEVSKTGSLVNVLPTALAIYLQPVFTGEKFNGEKLAETEKTVGRMSIYEALPLATFFFGRYFDVMKKKAQLYEETSLQKKLRQAQQA